MFKYILSRFYQDQFYHLKFDNWKYLMLKRLLEIMERLFIKKLKNLPSLCYYSVGLQPGDIVTHANGEPVLDTNSIYKILEEPGTIKLQILRKGRVLYIQVEPDET